MSAENPELPVEASETYDIRGLLEHKQSELDSVLETLGEEVEFWNLRLESAEATIELTKREVWNQLVVEAITNLDEQWPFMSDYLHVSGTWYVPEVMLASDMITFPMERREAFGTVQSNGFQALQEGDLPPRCRPVVSGRRNNHVHRRDTGQIRIVDVR